VEGSIIFPMFSGGLGSPPSVGNFKFMV